MCEVFKPTQLSQLRTAGEFILPDMAATARKHLSKAGSPLPASPMLAAPHCTKKQCTRLSPVRTQKPIMVRVFSGRAQKNGRVFGRNFRRRQQFRVLHDNVTGTLMFVTATKIVVIATAETRVFRNGLNITLGGRTMTYHRYTGVFECDNEEEAEHLSRYLTEVIAQLAIPQPAPADLAPGHGAEIPGDQPIRREPAEPHPPQNDLAPGIAEIPGDQPIRREPAEEQIPIHDPPVVLPEPPLRNPQLVPVDLPPPAGPRPLADLPNFVNECRNGQMSPIEAYRMFCTLFAAFVVGASGNNNHRGRYREMIDGSVVDTDKLTQMGKKCIIEAGPAARAVMSHF